jgi:hypothetical protein
MGFKVEKNIKKSLISLFHHDKKWYKGNYLSKKINFILAHKQTKGKLDLLTKPLQNSNLNK